VTRARAGERGHELLYYRFIKYCYETVYWSSGSWHHRAAYWKHFGLFVAVHKPNLFVYGALRVEASFNADSECYFVAPGSKPSRSDALAWPHTSIWKPRAQVLVWTTSSRRQTCSPWHAQTHLENSGTEGPITRRLQACQTLARYGLDYI